jgi:hypothetical protein
MPREVLRTLEADVRRLFTAGAASAPGDEGLRRRAETLRDLGRQVPALGRLAAAAERVTAAEPARAAAPLLDLLLVVRQVQGGLAGAEVEGSLAEVTPTGPWTTDAPTRLVHHLLEALQSRGRKATDTLEEAEEWVIGDLRLLGPLFALSESADGELVDLLVERVLPRLGPGVVAALWQVLCRDRRKAAWRLLTICRSNSAAGVGLCRLALGNDDLMLREGAISAIAQIGAAAASLIPDLVSGLQDSARSDRALYARALSKLGPPAKDAVPALCLALGDASPYVRVAAADALGQIGSIAALKPLAAAAKDAAPPELKRAAERALARLQNAQCGPCRGRWRLTQLLSDPDAAVRQAAQEATAAIRGE